MAIQGRRTVDGTHVVGKRISDCLVVLKMRASGSNLSSRVDQLDAIRYGRHEHSFVTSNNSSMDRTGGRGRVITPKTPSEERVASSERSHDEG